MKTYFWFVRIQMNINDDKKKIIYLFQLQLQFTLI